MAKKGKAKKGGMKMKKAVMPKELQGSGFMDWMRKAGSWINDGLKKTKLISTLAPLVPLPYAGAIGTVAKNAGYGRAGKKKFVMH